jgi:hypothetical protein
MSIELTGYFSFNIKKVKGYSDDDFNLVYWLSELYAVKSSGVCFMSFTFSYYK